METHAELELKVSVKDGKTCEKILKVEVDKETVQKEFDEFYRGIAPKAKVPGFRPGKAPRNILVLHYSSEARENVLKHLISESYRQALREHSLNPITLPEVEDVKFEENELSYQARFEIRPKIKLSRVSGLSAKKEKMEIKEPELNDALDRVRQSLAQFKVVEDRPAAMGDFVIADYVCTVDGKEVEKRQDDWFEIKEDEFLKGFSTQLVGVKPGEEKQVTIQFPDKLGRKELAGKQAAFHVKVKEIKAKNLPELNDEMAQAAGEFKTLEELKGKIRKDLETSKAQQNESKYETALLEELVKHNKIDLPEGLVQRRRERLLEDALQHMHSHGEDGKEKELKEKLAPEMEKEARRQVHLAFLLEEIAEKENLTVSEEDIKERFARVAAEVRQPVEAVEKYYAENEDARESLQDQIRNEKAIEFIKKNAKE